MKTSSPKLQPDSSQGAQQGAANSGTAASDQNAPIDDMHEQEMMLSAELAGMRYVSDTGAGFSRKRTKNGFRYLDRAGKVLTDSKHLSRIKALAIPPAWEDVWISPWHNSHMQATGRDVKQRKQYRYHARWREVRDEAKYERMMNFGLHLPHIRQQIDADLKRQGLCREKILATIVNLLEITMMRVGNEEYARTNQSFGITTLRNKHVQIDGTALEFHFRGKSRVDHLIKVTHPRLARIVKSLRDLPGQDLFQYVDADGVRHAVGSADVNSYLQEMTGEHYTAKDFRTWSGTIQAALALQALGQPQSEKDAKHHIVQAIAVAAKKLGNTPSICKKCYIHPLILEAYQDGSMFDSKAQGKPLAAGVDHALSEIEVFILQLLQHKIQQKLAGGGELDSAPCAATDKSRKRTGSRAKSAATA